jgi:hypothetical protein
MPIDTNIALQYRAPQIDFSQMQQPVNQMAQVYQLQHAQQQNQLGQMQMAEYERARESENKLRNLFANPEIDRTSPDFLRQIYAISPKQGIEIEKNLRETNKANLEIQKVKGELVDQRTKQSRELLDRIDPTSPDAARQYLAWHEANHNDPILGPTLKSLGADQQKAFADINRAIQTNTLPDLIEKSKLGMTKFQESRLPKPQAMDLHDRTVLVDLNPQSPTFTTELASSKKGTTSHEKMMENFRSKEIDEQKRTHGVTEKQAGQVITNAKGDVIVLDKSGKPMNTLPGAGKPSATFEKTQAQQKQLVQNRDLAITELEKAVKEGGLIDQSTGSGAGKIVDFGARFVGKATEGDIAIGKLQPIADLVLKMVPRFEGPQSDKDTASYKEAAGQLADAGLPRAIRKAAANEVLRLMKARKNQFVTEDMASGNVATPDTSPPAGFRLDTQ